MQRREATAKKIVVKAIDYDNCLGELAVLANPLYWEILSPKLKKQLFDSEKLTYKEAWKYFLLHSWFGENLIAQFKNKKISNIWLTCASSRQNLESDIFNRITNYPAFGNIDGGSVFKFIENFKQFIQEFLQEKSSELSVDKNDFIDYFPGLMQDFWNKEPTGTEFKQGLSSDYANGSFFAEKDTDNLAQLTALQKTIKKKHEGYFDNSKISVLYAQIHAFAILHPHETISFEFYDDKPEICAAVHAAFNAHPELLPDRVTLQIIHSNVFSTQQVYTNIVGHVHGLGHCDYNYHDNVKKLYAACEKKGITVKNTSQKINLEKVTEAMQQFKKELMRGIEELIFDLQVQIDSYVSQKQKLFFSFGGHNREANSLKLKLEEYRPKNYPGSQQDILYLLSSLLFKNWDHGCKKYAKKIANSSNPDMGLFALLNSSTNQTSFYHSIYQSLQLVANFCEKLQLLQLPEFSRLNTFLPKENKLEPTFSIDK